MSDDDEVTVIGVNAGRGELIYNPTLVSLARFGAADMPAPPLHDPVGVALDRAGLVAVGDRGNDRVVLLRFDARTRLRYAGEVTAGADGGAMSRPAGVAMTLGRLFVADTGNDRIVVVDTASGRAVRDINGVDAPFDVDAGGGLEESFGGLAFLAVTCESGARLTRIDLRGPGRRSVGYRESTGGGGKFDYAAIDYHGNVFVTDAVEGCVYKFTPDLQLLDRFECGADAGELGEPRGIAIHRRLGQVFIAERSGVSYYWVGTDIGGLSARVTAPGPTPTLEIRFVLTERSDVTLLLADGDGGVVDTLAAGLRISAGPARFTYAVDPPCPIATCTYRVVAEARATYAAREHQLARRWTPLGVRRPGSR